MPAMPGDAEMTQEAKQANAESGPVPGLATTPSVGYTEANLPPWRFWILSIG